jgi:cob(I)alamin adenosyltransferase
MKRTGLVHIYCGKGKGKTTAALGQALRLWGWGKKIIVFQFLKKKDFPSGEIKAREKLGKNFRIVRFDQEHPMFRKIANGSKLLAEKSKLKKAVFESLKSVQEILQSKKYDLVVLDEILNAVSENFVAESKVIDLIKNKPPGAELILTGRIASPGLIALADYASEIKEVKHPFRIGAKARKGIEF